MMDETKAALCIGKGMDLRAALAAAKAAGKPLLVEENLNAFLSVPRSPAELSRLATQAKGDLPSFLTAHFHLTPKQQEEVRKMPAAGKEQLRRLIDATVRSGGRLKATITALGPLPGGGVPDAVRSVSIEGEGHGGSSAGGSGKIIFTW